MLGVFIGLLLLFFILGIPVAFSIGYTCLLVIIAGSGLKDLSFDLFALQMMDGLNSFPLVSASFFVLAANVMNTSAITDRIFNFANALVGHLRGGLGHVNVVGSMIFAGMSGTAVADAAGLGNIEITAMRNAGYPMPLTVGITGASSILGPIIPPSIAMIFYGWLAGVSIGDLFIGGVIPGLAISQVEFLGDFTYVMPIEVFVPLYVIVGLLMVSPCDYNKLFSDIAKKGKKIIIFTIVLIVILLLVFKMWAVFIASSLYVLCGIVRYGYNLIKKIIIIQNSIFRFFMCYSFQK